MNKSPKLVTITRVIAIMLLMSPFFMLSIDWGIVATIVAPLLQVLLGRILSRNPIAPESGWNRAITVGQRLVAVPQAVVAGSIFALLVVPITAARRTPQAAKFSVLISTLLIAIGGINIKGDLRRLSGSDEALVDLCRAVNQPSFDGSQRNTLDRIVRDAQSAEPLLSFRYPRIWQSIAISCMLAGDDVRQLVNTPSIPEQDRERIQSIIIGSEPINGGVLKYLSSGESGSGETLADMLTSLTVVKALLDASAQGQIDQYVIQAGERLKKVGECKHLPSVNTLSGSPGPPNSWFSNASDWQKQIAELYLNCCARTYASLLIAVVRGSVTPMKASSLIAATTLQDDIEYVLFDAVTAIHKCVISSADYSLHSRLRSANNLADLQVRYLNELARAGPIGDHDSQSSKRRASIVREGERLLEDSRQSLYEQYCGLSEKNPYVLVTLAQICAALSHASYYKLHSASISPGESDRVLLDLETRLDQACRYISTALMSGLQPAAFNGHVHELGFCWLFKLPIGQAIEVELSDQEQLGQVIEGQVSHPRRPRPDVGIIAAARKRWAMTFEEAKWKIVCEKCSVEWR